MSNESADHFAPGTILSLFLTCNACIIKSFVPFTKSQVLPVELRPHNICGIYDPRFTSDREKPSPSSKIPGRPWSLSLEMAAAERCKAIARKGRLDDYDEMDFVDFDELLWEEFFYRAAEDAGMTGTRPQWGHGSHMA